MRTETIKRGNRYDLRFYQADVLTLRVSLTDEAGSAIDLTGKTIRVLLKENVFDTAAAFTLSCAIVGDAANGIVDVTITAASTANVRDYLAEIEVETTGGAGDIESHCIFTWRVMRDVG